MLKEIDNLTEKNIETDESIESMSKYSFNKIEDEYYNYEQSTIKNNSLLVLKSKEKYREDTPFHLNFAYNYKNLIILLRKEEKDFVDFLSKIAMSKEICYRENSFYNLSDQKITRQKLLNELMSIRSGDISWKKDFINLVLCPRLNDFEKEIFNKVDSEFLNYYLDNELYKEEKNINKYKEKIPLTIQYKIKENIDYIPLVKKELKKIDIFKEFKKYLFSFITEEEKKTFDKTPVKALKKFIEKDMQGEKIPRNIYDLINSQSEFLNILKGKKNKNLNDFIEQFAIDVSIISKYKMKSKKDDEKKEIYIKNINIIKNEVIKIHLAMVNQIALDFVRKTKLFYLMDDLRSNGIFGINLSLYKFAIKKGFKFITFCRQNIYYYISMLIKEQFQEKQMTQEYSRIPTIILNSNNIENMKKLYNEIINTETFEQTKNKADNGKEYTTLQFEKSKAPNIYMFPYEINQEIIQKISYYSERGLPLLNKETEKFINKELKIKNVDESESEIDNEEENNVDESESESEIDNEEENNIDKKESNNKKIKHIFLYTDSEDLLKDLINEYNISDISKFDVKEVIQSQKKILNSEFVAFEGDSIVQTQEYDFDLISNSNETLLKIKNEAQNTLSPALYKTLLRLLEGRPIKENRFNDIAEKLKDMKPKEKKRKLKNELRSLEGIIDINILDEEEKDKLDKYKFFTDEEKEFILRKINNKERSEIDSLLINEISEKLNKNYWNIKAFINNYLNQ